MRGTPCRSLLRHFATSQKVAGSILDWVIGVFHCLTLSGCTMALGSTQPLKEMSTSVIIWRRGKDGQCVGLTTLYRNSVTLNLLEP